MNDKSASSISKKHDDLNELDDGVPDKLFAYRVDGSSRSGAKSYWTFETSATRTPIRVSESGSRS